MGLGGFDDVTLAQAREKARQARQQAIEGIDPVQERKAARLRRKTETVPTFRKCAHDLYGQQVGSGQ